MGATGRTIEVDPGSELARLLDESETAFLELVRNGVRYRLQRVGVGPTAPDETSEENIDDEEDRRALETIIGSWADVDADELIAELHGAREEGSRSAVQNGWTDRDTERARNGMNAAAGSWKDVDTERLKADVRRWRDEGSRPADRS